MINPVQEEIEKLVTETPSVDRQIDRIGQAFQGAIQNFFQRRGEPGQQLREFLSGDRLGYPLHATLNDLPVGAWTSAIIFDYLGSISGIRALRRAGDLLTGLGVVGALAASVAGLADYSELTNEERRFGTVHAILNGATLVAYTDSLLQRAVGNRGAAVSLSTLGFLGLLVSTDVGRTLVYRYGAMVNRPSRQTGPSEFTSVMPADQLGDGQTEVRSVGNATVLLARVNGEVYAIDDICPHDGCSLGRGLLVETSIVCPCDNLRFSLLNGQVIDGPSQLRATCYDVQIENGMIEVRRQAT